MTDSRLKILSLLVFTLLYGWSFMQYAPFKNNQAIKHDVTIYYSYLPAFFIHNDADLRFVKDLPKHEPVNGVWVNVDEKDRYSLKMTVGLSYFYFPTFLVGHAVAKNSDQFTANGYSYPYQIALAMNTFLVGLGSMLLWFFYLWKRYGPRVTFGAIALIFFGTNLFYYSVGVAGLSHVYTFFLGSVIVVLTHFLHEREGSIWHWMFLGLCLGLMVLIRPINVIIGLYPLLYGCNDALMRARKVKILKSKAFLWLLAFAILPILPQLWYWKMTTGDWVTYSYAGERFFFGDSKVLAGWFGFKKGWLIYTPGWILGLVGLGFGAMKKVRAAALPLFLVFSYAVFAWWCWWYGGSFGSRVMIDFTPLLVLPLCVTLAWVFKKGKGVSIAFGLMLTGFIYLNVYQTNQYQIGMMHWDGMNKEAYKAIFLKDKPPPNFNQLLTPPDYEKAKTGERDF